MIILCVFLDDFIITEEIEMSTNTKKQYKQFTINTIEDACSVLGSLISCAIVHFDKYSEYSLEAEMLLECSDTPFINAKLYDDIHDKLLFRQHELLKLCADHQKSSFSYADFRKFLEKKGYIKKTLPNEVENILRDFLDIRNWSFHNPQSLMVATKEVTEKNMPDFLKGNVTIVPQLNPLFISKVDKYELMMLASLTIHTQKRREQFLMVINSMKSDYEELYSYISSNFLFVSNGGLINNVQYLEKYETGKLMGYQSDIIQLSMAIQKSKYDGSSQAFKEWSLRFEKNDSSD